MHWRHCAAATRGCPAIHRWNDLGKNKARRATGEAKRRIWERMQQRLVLQAAKQKTASCANSVASALPRGGQPLRPTLPVWARLLSLANGGARLCKASLATANLRVRHLRGRNTSVSPNSNPQHEGAMMHLERRCLLIPSSSLGPRHQDMLQTARSGAHLAASIAITQHTSLIDPHGARSTT